MRLALALVLLLASATWAEATTYWVNPAGTGGTNPANCASATSKGAGMTTVTAGVACLSAADTLIIADGTYAENLGSGTAIPSGTSDTVRTTIQAENNNLAILQPGAGQCGTHGVLAFKNRSNITVTGLYLDANGICATALMFITQAASDTTENITFQDGTIEDAVGTAGGTGMVWAGRWDATPTNNAENIQILRNTIRRMDVAGLSVGNHCMYFKPNNSLVEGNTIGPCYGSGYTSHVNAGSKADSNIIRGNTFQDCDTGPGIRASGSSHQVQNNIVLRCGGIAAGNSHYAIVVHLNSSTDVEIDNNTIFDSDEGCIDVSSTASNTKIRNNICDGTNATIRDNGTGANKETQTNRCDSGCFTSADPLFTDELNEDFTLQSGSPMRDVGTTIAAVTTDFAGLGRPQGSRYDIGAYEFTSETGGACPSSIGLVARYWMDHASSGQSPTILVDTGPAPTVDMAITYGASGQPDWDSEATGFGLRWATVNSSGKAEASIDSTKIHTQLHACKALTVATVVDLTAVGTSGARIVQLGSGAATLKFAALSFSTTSIRFSLTMSSTTYSVDFPHTHASEGRTVLHFVVDTTQATEADRIKMYRDGSGVTATSGTYPAQNATWDLETGQVLTVGNRPDQVRSPQGAIYYVAIYDSALSSGDVSTNATALATLDDADPITPPSEAQARHGRGRLR